MTPTPRGPTDRPSDRPTIRVRGTIAQARRGASHVTRRRTTTRDDARDDDDDDETRGDGDDDDDERYDAHGTRSGSWTTAR